MTIMIIDDDTDDSLLFQEALKGIAPDITCVVANSCLEAIAAINEPGDTPDIIFLDAYMYPQGGKESLLMLNNIPKLTDARIIIHSGSLSESQINEFRILGADDIMLKASSFDSLEKKLRTILTL